jgi:hypothetical protein
LSATINDKVVQLVALGLATLPLALLFLGSQLPSELGLVWDLILFIVFIGAPIAAIAISAIVLINGEGRQDLRTVSISTIIWTVIEVGFLFYAAY